MALKSPKEKPKSDSKPEKKLEKPMTKVVIRRLPPNMTEEEFLNNVSPIPEYDYICCINGDKSLGENAFGRVYVNFVVPEEVYDFKEKFDNYVFIDGSGHEYTAVVEYAAFQKIPKRKKRADPRCGSIELDPLYIEFVESLNNLESLEEKPEYTFQPTVDGKGSDMSTPLLEFLKQRKLDKQKARDEKREEKRRKDIEKKRLKEDRKRRQIEEKNREKKTDLAIGEDVVLKISDKEDTSTATKVDEKPIKTRKYEEKSFVNSKLKKQRDRFEERKELKNRKDSEQRSKSAKSDGSGGPSKNKELDAKSSATMSRKVKKYSERREERKIEAKKAEQEYTDTADVANDINDDTSINAAQQCAEPRECKKVSQSEDEYTTDGKSAGRKKSVENLENADVRASDSVASTSTQKSTEKTEKREEEKPRRKAKNKENDPRAQRRIRNKDRPTMAIYQPGMLKKKTNEPSSPTTPDPTPSLEFK